MKKNDSSNFRTSQHRRCDIRLENDVEGLEAAVSERMKVEVHRFGSRPRWILLSFPKVQTAFFYRAEGAVQVLPWTIVAEIYPNSGNQFPYPLGSPMVKIFYPKLKWDWVPWLSGLLWLKDKKPYGHQSDNLPPGIKELVDGTIGLRYPEGIGLPCLWRDGEWTKDCDLLFTARQIHRLLTDPRYYSPGDSLNPDAAMYWAEHRDLLPLEPVIPQLVQPVRRRPAARGSKEKLQFSLTEVE